MFFQNSPALSGCQRYDNFFKYIDGVKLAEEAAIFGLESKATLAIPINEQALRTSIQLAKEKVPGTSAMQLTNELNITLALK